MPRKSWRSFEVPSPPALAAIEKQALNPKPWQRVGVFFTEVYDEVFLRAFGCKVGV